MRWPLCAVSARQLGAEHRDPDASTQAAQLRPPAGLTWGDVDAAIRRHYGCDAHESEAMRRTTLADPNGWRISALALYAEIPPAERGRA